MLIAKELKDECRNTCSKSKDSSSGGDLVGTIDSDNTRSGGGGDWDVGGSSSGSAFKRRSGTTTKSSRTRYDGERRRSTSHRRHKNAAGLRNGRHTGTERREWDREARNADTGDRNTVTRNHSRRGLSAGHVSRISTSHDDWSRGGHADGAGAS